MARTEIATRFCQLTARYGYKRGIRLLQREYDPDTFTDFATENRQRCNPPAHAATTLKVDEAHTRASDRWSDLYENTAVEVA